MSIRLQKPRTNERRSQRHEGLLDLAVAIGPQAQLRPWYERLYFVQTLLPQLCNIVVAALGHAKQRKGRPPL